MKKLLGHVFQAGLRLNAGLTRGPARPLAERLLTPLFVRLTRAIRGVRRVGPTPEALGREWERLLGDRRYARITRVDPLSETAYGEISGLCPLRGTGDLAACHRLMAYDRQLMAPHGAHFVVLASQAEPGRSTCEIAIRRRQRSVADLVPAHTRQRTETADTDVRTSEPASESMPQVSGSPKPE